MDNNYIKNNYEKINQEKEYKKNKQREYKRQWYLKNREKILEKNKYRDRTESSRKSYYKNIEKIKERRKKKKYCDICDVGITILNFSRHLQSWKHINNKIEIQKALKEEKKNNESN